MKRSKKGRKKKNRGGRKFYVVEGIGDKGVYRNLFQAYNKIKRERGGSVVSFDTYEEARLFLSGGKPTNFPIKKNKATRMKQTRQTKDAEDEMIFYSVRNGRKNGVYTSLSRAKEMTEGFPESDFRKMKNHLSALAYASVKEGAEIKDLLKLPISKKMHRGLSYIMRLSERPNSVVIFTDGSFKSFNTKRHKANVYGYGFLIVKSGKIIAESTGGGSDNFLSNFGSSGSEVAGVLKALNVARKIDGVKSLYIFHDFNQLREWFVGGTKVKNDLSKKYIRLIEIFEKKEGLDIHFEKVEAHSDNLLNERVDQLAKEGLKMTNREIKRKRRKRESEERNERGAPTMVKKESYYAVAKGRVPGIYETWDECKEQVFKFSGAIFKKFKTREEGENFLKTINSDNSKKENGEDLNHEEVEVLTKKLSEKKGSVVLYVDGSSMPHEKDSPYGFGFVVVDNNEVIYEESGGGNNPEINNFNNVAGEILAVLKGVQWIRDNCASVNQINVFYDYMGIEQWVNGSWRAKTNFTKRYAQSMNKFQEKHNISINFVKVRAHNNHFYNERADELAKQGLKEQEDIIKSS